MIGRVLALGASIILISAGTAGAQDDEEEYSYEKETSPYAELYGAGGYFLINGSDGGNDGSGGFGAALGGHFTSHLAMEGQYEYQSYSNTSLASYNFKYVMLTGRVQPYAKVGIGLMAGRPNHPFLFMGRFDLGMTFFLTDQWGLRGGVSYAVAKHSNHLLLGNAGVIYYFE
jgi:hypothetical protein